METKFIFNDTVVMELNSDEETMMLYVAYEGDEQDKGRGLTLDANEIELLIATLSFYKTQLKTN